MLILPDLAYAPSKFQLLFVDFSILFFQMLTCCISFEMQTPESSAEDSTDYLLATPTSPVPPLETPFDQKAFESPNNEPQYIIDIRLSSIIGRLRNPPATISRTSSSQDSLIPFPNTTTWPIPMSLLMRTGRRRQGAERTTALRGGQESREPRTVPGGMNTENLD